MPNAHTPPDCEEGYTPVVVESTAMFTTWHCEVDARWLTDKIREQRRQDDGLTNVLLVVVLLQTVIIAAMLSQRYRSKR